MPSTSSKPSKPRSGKTNTPHLKTGEDHRTRTGANRREQTRLKLLAAAMAVFARDGLDTPSIDDFIAQAGVARGTFYNYFSTTAELLDAVTADMSDTIFNSIEKVVLPIPDPLERMTCACLLYMNLGVELPNWGAFVIRTGMRNKAIGKQLDIYLPRDLELAREAGKVSYPSVRAARDLIFASINQATRSVLSGVEPREHLHRVFALVLKGLGVPPAKADALSKMHLPEIDLPVGAFREPLKTTPFNASVPQP